MTLPIISFPKTNCLSRAAELYITRRKKRTKTPKTLGFLKFSRAKIRDFGVKSLDFRPFDTYNVCGGATFEAKTAVDSRQS